MKPLALAIAITILLSSCSAGSINSGQLAPTDDYSSSEPINRDRFIAEGVMPDFVGISSIEAIPLAGKSGYYPVFYELIDGEPDDIYYMEDETDKLEGFYVCSQNYPVGAEVDPETWMTQLHLIVDRTCESITNYYRVGGSKLDSAIWEPSPFSYESSKIEGWIFGYGWNRYSHANEVEVMTASGVREFEIAQVDVTADVSCYFEDEDYLNHIEEALALKRQLLPLGSPVLLVKDGSSFGSSGFFFHVLSNQGVNVGGEPPKGSINEALVRSGLWALDSSVYLEKPDYVKPTMQKFKINKDFVGDEELASGYAKLMVSAANEARKGSTPVMKACLKAADELFVGFWGTSDARGESNNGSWSSGGGGGGCTYVSGYFRRGHYVRGYLRC